jgi:hypothetical protein
MIQATALDTLFRQYFQLIFCTIVSSCYGGDRLFLVLFMYYILKSFNFSDLKSKFDLIYNSKPNLLVSLHILNYCGILFELYRTPYPNC